MVDNMVQEGDEDAALVTDFESAAADLLQSDEELASAYTAYADARRRLNEKVRAVREAKGFQQRCQRKIHQGTWIFEKIVAAMHT